MPRLIRPKVSHTHKGAVPPIASCAPPALLRAFEHVVGSVSPISGRVRQKAVTERGPGDVRSPSELHPVFYGSFDWHSNVHGYWLLATIYRRVPGSAGGGEDSRAVRRAAHAEKRRGRGRVPGEPSRGTFERPYGWAWLLMLAAELGAPRRTRGDDGRARMRPLAEHSSQRFREFLPKATYPDSRRHALQHRVRADARARVRRHGRR